MCRPWLGHPWDHLLPSGGLSHDVDVSADERVARPSWKRLPWRRGTLPKRGLGVASDCVLALLIAAVAVGVAGTEMNGFLKVLVAVLAVVNILLAVQEVLLWRRAHGAESKR